MYNEGISVSGDVLDLGVLKNVITKSGNAFNFGEIKLGVGHETARQFLKQDPKLREEIRKKIITASKAEV